MSENINENIYDVDHILLKRTTNGIAGTTSVSGLSFGEVIVVSDTVDENESNYLAIQPNGESSNKTFVKGQPDTIVNNAVYFTEENGQIQLTDDNSTPLSFDVSAGNVSYISGTTTYTDGTVGDTLNDILSGDTFVENAVNANNFNVTVGTSTQCYVIGVTDTSGYNSGYINTKVYFDASSGVLYGAAWNDFAEHRLCTTDTPGVCVVESVNGVLIPSEAYKQGGACIISDTYGMVIGEKSENSSPVAVAGRVLAFVENKEKLQPGDALKTAPEGKLAKMSRHEIRRYPDRIVGYVSEIPTYETWNNVEVNGRVWVKI